jgi:hypothetical protein
MRSYAPLFRPQWTHPLSDFKYLGGIDVQNDMELTVTVATVFIDLQVDFFSHERLRRNRELLTLNANALATSARRYGSPVIWVKQIHAADLHDASILMMRNITQSA